MAATKIDQPKPKGLPDLMTPELRKKISARAAAFGKTDAQWIIGVMEDACRGPLPPIEDFWVKKLAWWKGRMQAGEDERREAFSEMQVPSTVWKDRDILEWLRTNYPEGKRKGAEE